MPLLRVIISSILPPRSCHLPLRLHVMISGNSRLYSAGAAGNTSDHGLPQLDLWPQGFVDGSLHPIFKIAARKNSDVLEPGCPEIASDALALAATDHGDVRLLFGILSNRSRACFRVRPAHSSRNIVSFINKHPALVLYLIGVWSTRTEAHQDNALGASQAEVHTTLKIHADCRTHFHVGNDSTGLESKRQTEWIIRPSLIEHLGVVPP